MDMGDAGFSGFNGFRGLEISMESSLRGGVTETGS